MTLNRRTLLIAAGGLTIAGFTFRPAYAGLPKLAKKEKYKVGFAQTESNNPWRLAQSKSMVDEAAKRGWQLVATDAAGSAAKQVADVRSMIAQKVDFILLAPREEKPLIPAVMEAKKAGIPLILVDRNVDQSLAKGGEDYVAFIGSDFVKEKPRLLSFREQLVAHQLMIACQVLRATSRTTQACKSLLPSQVTLPATKADKYSKHFIRLILRLRRSTHTMMK